MVALLPAAIPKKTDGTMTQWCGVAKDEADARLMASQCSCDEGADVWTDPERSKVEPIDPNTRRTIMTDAGDEAVDGF